jgi:hypothetical protein
MAVTTIAHKPNLTADQVKEIFRRNFEGRYTIVDGKGAPIGPKRDFMVVKNAFVAVSIKLEQGQSETKFVYTGITPKVWARLLLGALLGFILWTGLTNEVKQFIETAPEFK